VFRHLTQFPQNKQVKIQKEEEEEKKELTVNHVAVQALNSINPQHRKEFLLKICEEISEEKLQVPLPPKLKSIALDRSMIELKSALQEVV